MEDTYIQYKKRGQDDFADQQRKNIERKISNSIFKRQMKNRIITIKDEKNIMWMQTSGWITKMQICNDDKNKLPNISQPVQIRGRTNRNKTTKAVRNDCFYTKPVIRYKHITITKYFITVRHYDRNSTSFFFDNRRTLHCDHSSNKGYRYPMVLHFYVNNDRSIWLIIYKLRYRTISTVKYLITVDWWWVMWANRYQYVTNEFDSYDNKMTGKEYSLVIDNTTIVRECMGCLQTKPRNEVMEK